MVSKKYLVCDRNFCIFINKKEGAVMINVNKNLINEVLELNPQEKIFLVEAIVESLDKPDKNIQEIWLKEAKERLESHRSGDTKGIPLEDVLGESL